LQHAHRRRILVILTIQCSYLGIASIGGGMLALQVLAPQLPQLQLFG
jgi:hypothetical protein